MKKHILLLLPFILIGCSNSGQSSLPASSSSTSDTPSSQVSSEPSSQPSSSQGKDPVDNIYNESFRNLIGLNKLEKKEEIRLEFKDEYEDDSFDEGKIINGFRYENTKMIDFGSEEAKGKDYKSIFYNDKAARFVNISDGYAITMPTTTTLNADFSLGDLRSKIYNEESTLTISVEDQNPYTDNEKGWNTYRDEWITIYLERDKWYVANNVDFTREKKYEDTSFISGYSIIEYDLVINENGNISKPYYNICILRKTNSYKLFHLFVMKSATNQNDKFDQIIKSFTEIEKLGRANSSTLYSLPAEDNPKWNKATKRYYHKLIEQEYTDWGLYNGNLPMDISEGHCDEEELKAYKEKKAKIEKDFDYEFDVISSYNHVSWHGDFSVFYFPLQGAREVCGDGYDGKPILQFSYQYTDNNNRVDQNEVINMFSPQFEILRGQNKATGLDDYRNGIYKQLVDLAHAIKAYEKPVMLRLNNEMNTDWCTYCGLMNLLDPDLFQAGWRIMYNIFEEQEVDNVMWIWNPITPSYPYSRWGKELCYYPGNDYVNVIGLTYYIMNNEEAPTTKTFKNAFYEVYTRNGKYFENYPWYISEFACGAGNKNFQHEASQTAYIENMWDCLNAETRKVDMKNIKGAIWFNCNDYKDNGDIANALSFYNRDLTAWAVPNSAAAFIKGLHEQRR